MSINPVFDKLIDLLTRKEGVTVERFRLSPVANPKTIVYEMSDGTDVSLEGDYPREQLEAWAFQTKGMWKYLHQVAAKLPKAAKPKVKKASKKTAAKPKAKHAGTKKGGGTKK